MARMNRLTRTITPALLAASTLAACQRTAEPPAATPATVIETMNGIFTPQAGKLWEIAGALYADNGELDANLLADAQWQELATAATSLRDVARELAGAAVPRVAPEGVKIQNEDLPGALGASQVQALMDADPEGFRQEARLVSSLAADVIAAAAARDAARVDEASNRLNDTCTSCHSRFWYPDQPPPQ